MKHLLIATVALSSVLAASSAAVAAELSVVPAGGNYGTIQAAIDAARDGDTVLVMPGEYLITEPITFRGKAITVKSERGPEETTIRMSQSPVDPQCASVVVFENNESRASVLEGFTLTGGTGRGNQWNTRGGGVLIEESSPAIRNCTITGNRSTLGGGIYCEGDAAIVNCTIMGNCCDDPDPGGGGIHFFGYSPMVSNCLIVGNMSLSSGGGIQSVSSWLTLVNCTISGNQAREGAGLFSSQTSFEEISVTVVNCIFWDNVNTGPANLDSWPAGFRVDNLTNPLRSPFFSWQEAFPEVRYSLAESFSAFDFLSEPGEGSIDRDPLFVSAGVFDFERFRDDGVPDFIVDRGDYRLQRGSPAIDQGTSDGAPEIDFTGTARPCWNRIDLGAHEYCDESPPTHPQAHFTVTPHGRRTPLFVEVDATESTNEDGTMIVSYDWDFGDGAAAEGITASHTYTIPGRWKIALTITTNEGYSDTEIWVVSVEMGACCFEFASGGSSVAVDSTDRIIVADLNNNRVQVFDSAGNFLFEFWGNPWGVAVDSTDRIIVADARNHRVHVFDSAGNFLFRFRSEGTGEGEFGHLTGVAVDSTDRIIFTDERNHRVQVFDSGGNFLFEFGTEGQGDGEFRRPRDVAVDSSDRIIVVDKLNDRVQVFDSGGNFLFKLGSTQGGGDGQFSDPTGVAVDSRGKIIVADTHRIQVFDSAGNFLFKFGSQGTGHGQFGGVGSGYWGPFVAVDSTDRIIVTDRYNYRVQVFGRSAFEDPVPFLRGDCNDDGEVDIADGPCILDWLFAGEATPGCLAAANTNGDDDANIADAMHLLNHLFSEGPAPVAPFPDCGPGLLPADAELGCSDPPDCQ